MALLLAVAPAHAVQRGESLIDALKELRRAGLRLVFSSELVKPDLVVTVDPGSGSAEDQARAILAPHGLALESLRPGTFAIVKRPDPTPAPASQIPANATRASAGSLLEVGVYASRYEVQREDPSALAELTREDLETRPGLDQDVLRVTRYLPGTASNSLSARTHVRGGRDDEVAVMFDGVPLFEPFHYKDVQGFLGILDPGTVSSVEFFSGVFPARYGNRLSGVLDIKPRVWSGHNYHELGASLLYSHALTQGRLESHPVEWLAAVRRSNVQLVADLLDRNDFEPNFLDALGRVQFDVGDRSSVTLGWLLLDDDLSANLSNGGEQGEIRYRDATGWARWRFAPSPRLETRATLSLTERHTDRNGTLQSATTLRGSVNDRRRFDTVSARLEGKARLSDRWRLDSGIEWYDFDASYDYQSVAEFDPVFAAALDRPLNVIRDTDVRFDGEAYAAHLSALASFGERVDLDFGLRWDAQRYGAAFHETQLSPRLSVQYRYDPGTIFRLSWGRLAQAQRPDELQVQDGEISLAAPQRGTHAVMSLERRLSAGTLLRVEAFDKRISSPRPDFENLLDPFTLFPELEVDRTRVAPERSRAYGAEMSLRWNAWQTLSGWTSYSFSEVTDHFATSKAPRTWDQKHSVAVGLVWNLNPWTLSANGTWHSGWRSNALSLVSGPGASTPLLELAPRNASAWGDYISLDVRAGWMRPLSRGELHVFVEVDNLTANANTCCVNYELTEGLLTSERSAWIPRFVLAGVTWKLP